MTPAEVGRRMAADAPPLEPWQIDEAARILAAVAREQADPWGKPERRKVA